MKNLKKATALFTAAALCMGMATTALATDTSPTTLWDEGSASIGVTGSYNGTQTEPEKNYKIDIAWGSMEFTYDANVTRTWDTESHQYIDNGGQGTWKAVNDGTSNKITVTNHSNAEVTAAFSFVGTPETITGQFVDSQKNEKASIVLGSADVANAAVEDSVFFNITGGTLSSDTTANTSIGTITVTLTK